jgi:ketosteroid isomerase-like protein
LTQVPDLIEPPAASQPAQALLLTCDALTAGDLEAAVALYEPDAALLWGPERAAMGHAAIRRVLEEVMDIRLPVRGRADHTLLAGDLALIIGERSMHGTGPDGTLIALTGPATMVVRCQPDGTWLTVADDWNPYTGH